MTGPILICGGDDRLARRAACPEPVHNWPLPAGYVDAAEAAGSRLNRHWVNVRCPRCRVYGWRPGRIDGETRVAS